MKFGFMFFLVTFPALAVPPHMDLELTSREYEALLVERPILATLMASDTEHALQKVVDLGKRNLEWLQHMNTKRAPDQKLSFSNAATQSAYPIEAPGESNEAKVLGRYDDLQQELPEEMKAVLFGGSPFSDAPPISEENYLAYGRKIDRVYQSALRWILQLPYLDYYAARRNKDIRGFYFLQKEPELEKKLRAFVTLPSADKIRLRGWLVGLCLNEERLDREECEAKLASGERANRVWNFYQEYLSSARAMYNSYFDISVRRYDIQWNSAHEDVLAIPFVDPKNNAVLHFLRDNIEDEFRWQNWRLQMNFTDDSFENYAYVEFVPGATPHVDSLGGSRITMDANAPLTEYDVRWTIRHEFGHVLGFPDCYVEFLEAERGVMVNYQIDTSNLMCSRRGRLQERHYLEMRRVYFRNGNF